MAATLLQFPHVIRCAQCASTEAEALDSPEYLEQAPVCCIDPRQDPVICRSCGYDEDGPDCRCYDPRDTMEAHGSYYR